MPFISYAAIHHLAPRIPKGPQRLPNAPKCPATSLKTKEYSSKIKQLLEGSGQNHNYVIHSSVYEKNFRIKQNWARHGRIKRG